MWNKIKIFAKIPLMFLWRLGWKCRCLCYGQAVPIDKPCLLIGSLRAGGGGRTTVVLSLAQILHQMGLRVAVLGHPLYLGKVKIPQKVRAELDLHQQKSTDEALLLARAAPVDVWICSNRATWIKEYQHHYDFILIDDGLEDPRLEASTRIRLRRRDEPSYGGWGQLLPLGPWRSLPTDHKNLIQWREGVHYHCVQGLPTNYQGQILDYNSKALLVTGLGDSDRFRKNLSSLGFEHLVPFYRPDHDRHFVNFVQDCLNEGGDLVMSPKDSVRLTKDLLQDPRIFVSSYDILWDFPIKAFLSALQEKTCNS